MTASTRVDVPRSDVVGSLLRPAYLREARKGVREGKLGAAELRTVEDRAVREAIVLQESAGIDVITDGELRRNSWVVTIPLREEVVVLGLLTTKQGALEDAAAIEARIREATKYVPLERLAVSPQCGFASGEQGNPLTLEQQKAKLRRVGEVARKVWPR